MDNPWLHLPAEPPYVLSEDAEAVARFNRTAQPDHFLHVDKILPEPFVGVADAPIILLSNNPGFSSREEREKFRQQPTVLGWMRKNLHHEQLNYPFYYLNPDFDENDWWVVRLRPLIERFNTPPQNGRLVVARSVLNVVYFPYPSRRFGHRRLHLHSSAQEYNFSLVREAVNRNALVVLLRSGKANQKAWLKAVPELNGKLLLGKNPQAPYISLGNCPGFFETIVQAVAAFTKCQATTP